MRSRPDFARSLRSRMLLVALTISWVPMGESFGSSPKPNLKELMTISSEDIPGDYDRLYTGAFAIAPDDRTVVAGFTVSQVEAKPSLWLGKWEVGSKRLLVQTTLQPASKKTPISFALMALQFAPSGKLLLAQTDEGIDIFDAGNLKIVHSIHIASQNFTISGDGHILALVSKQRPSLVHIINLDSGEEMASWVVPSQVRAFHPTSLSIRGAQMLMVSPGSPPDILLVDSFSGKLLRTFASGFSYGPPGYGLDKAQFIDDNQFLASTDNNTNTSGHYAGQSIKIVDVHSGAIVRELTYKHFGPTPYVFVSRQSGALAMVNCWRSPSENRADVEKPAQLLVFRLDQTKPFCVIEHFPQAQGTISGDPVQASIDLNLIGVYLSDRITVYEIANCSL